MAMESKINYSVLSPMDNGLVSDTGDKVTVSWEDYREGSIMRRAPASGFPDVQDGAHL